MDVAYLWNTITGSRYPNNIVVVGGLASSDSSLALNSVEIFQTDLGTWTNGPDFPGTIFGMAMVQYSSDDIIAIGGNVNGRASSGIYSLSKSDLSAWRHLGDTAQARYAQVAVLVPRHTFSCLGDPMIEDFDPMMRDEELIEDLTLLED